MLEGRKITTIQKCLYVHEYCTHWKIANLGNAIKPETKS